MYKFKKFNKKGIEHGVLEKKIELEKDIDTIIQKTDTNRVVYPEQVHKEKVHICKSNDKRLIKNVDGLITDQKNQALLIRTADCIPVFLYDNSKNRVGLIHAGFKGLVKGIIKNTLSHFNSKKTIAGLGPHIRKEYYLRGDNKKYYKRKEFKNYFNKKEEKLYFSITKLAKDQLINNGILKENIEDCGICTYCSNNFLSARKQGKKFDCFGSFIKL